jgi:phytoene synthase
LFVPRDLLERHGCDLEQVFAGQDSQQLHAALGELAEDARSHLDMALALLPGTPRDARMVFLPLALVRPELDRMVRAGANPFMPQAASRLRTLWTLWRASRSKAFRA